MDNIEMSNEEFDKFIRLKQELEAQSSPMQLFMSQLHEMYTSLKKAGFSRKEALLIISRLFNEMILGGMDQGKNE